MMKKLLKIQSELKVPKGQMNKSWNYKYRSCEDIIETVKPLLQLYSCIIILSDELVVLWDWESERWHRYYVKATATIIDTETNERISTTWYAREEETKKGMDWSQITGASSSYARKYALNGLLAIDDTKDSDWTNTHWKDIEEQSKEEIKSDLKCVSCWANVSIAVAKYSEDKFGNVLCLSCQKK